MIRSLLTAAAIASLAAAVPAVAAPCKDPKTGKFTKCPPAAPAAGTRCKDTKGRFAKCGTPGAVPIAKK